MKKRKAEKLLILLALTIVIGFGAWRWLEAKVSGPALVSEGKNEGNLKNSDIPDENKQAEGKGLAEEEKESAQDLKNKRAKEEVLVYIDGRIKEPGLYSLDKGSRIADVIDAAGGLCQDADISFINPAAKVEDEMKISIPSINDVDESTQKIKANLMIGKSPGTIAGNKKETGEKGTININKASMEELKELPQIGEKKALAIIEYRNERPFENVEDIKEVSGIGDKLYERIKDMIRVSD